MTTIKTFLVVMMISTQPHGQNYVFTFEQRYDAKQPLDEARQDCWVEALYKKRDYEAKAKGVDYRVRTTCYQKAVDR